MPMPPEHCRPHRHHNATPTTIATPKNAGTKRTIHTLNSAWDTCPAARHTHAAT
ncbi:MAG: hypothetical protein LBD14_01285 [Puniceicoccales bacterium]|nr:hypothetical protein [Puniceicoccales bacterium]